MEGRNQERQRSCRIGDRKFDFHGSGKMTRQERVNRYVEILNKYEEGSSGWNWGILDSLSDAELFEEEKIAEKIHIIQKHQMRIENSPNKYSESVMECIRQRFGLEKYDDSRDEEINKLSPDEVFEHVCEWNGLLGYAYTIKSWFRNIYKVKLNNGEE